MSTLVTVSGWFTILTAAGGQADDPSKKAIAELQGVWKLVTLERDDDVGDVADRSCYWLVKGSKVFYGGDELATLAPDAGTTPRSLDLTFRSPEAQREGIYTVKDGTWKICVNWDAAAVKERPEQFSTKDKPAYRILTFERVKLTEAEAASDGLGYVGIALRKREDTLVVGMVLPDSPANKAGLAQDDQILQNSRGRCRRSTVNGQGLSESAARKRTGRAHQARGQGEGCEDQGRHAAVPLPG